MINCSKGGIELRGDLKHIPAPEHLLYAARDSGRAVVDDCGSRPSPRPANHRTPTCGSESCGRSISQRKWRAGGRRTDGQRKPGHLGKIIAPWSERVRYSMKKHGDHGRYAIGMRRPMSRAGDTIKNFTKDSNDWDECPLDQPDWWSRREPLRNEHVKNLLLQSEGR